MIKFGVFTYSREEGTPAAEFENQIHHNTKKSRYNKIMETAKKISEENLKTCIGKRYKVLIESKSFDNKYYIRKKLYGYSRYGWSCIYRKYKRCIRTAILLIVK